MSYIEGPFIITDKKRKLEIERIKEYIKLIKVDEKINSYLSLEHFIYSSNGKIYSGNKIMQIYPLGYIDKDKAIIYIPRVLDHSFESTNNFIVIYNKIITELKNKNIKNWVLDLRGNGGGLISLFFHYIKVFVPEYSFELIDNLGRKQSHNFTNENGNFWDMKILSHKSDFIKNANVTVLLNEYSFSGSLFLAYILKKKINAKIIGGEENKDLTLMHVITTDLGTLRIPRYLILDPRLKNKRYI